MGSWLELFKKYDKWEYVFIWFNFYIKKFCFEIYFSDIKFVIGINKHIYKKIFRYKPDKDRTFIRYTDEEKLLLKIN